MNRIWFIVILDTSTQKLHWMLVDTFLDLDLKSSIISRHCLYLNCNKKCSYFRIKSVLPSSATRGQRLSWFSEFPSHSYLNEPLSILISIILKKEAISLKTINVFLQCLQRNIDLFSQCCSEFENIVLCRNRSHRELRHFHSSLIVVYSLHMTSPCVKSPCLLQS